MPSQHDFLMATIGAITSGLLTGLAIALSWIWLQQGA